MLRDMAIYYLQAEYLVERGGINKEEGLSITQSVKISSALSQHDMALLAGEPWLEDGVWKRSG